MAKRLKPARFAVIGAVLAVLLGAIGVIAVAQAPEFRDPFGGHYPTYEPDDNTGFVPIFDGNTLARWDGDTTFWRAEDGAIIGESTPEKVVENNNFLI